MTWKDYKREISQKEKLPENYYILGIDLGTTNSVISFFDPDTEEPEPVDISMGFGKTPLPSVVQYRPDEDEWIIGDEAFRTMQLYPKTTIRSVKSMLGTGEKIQIAGESYYPEEISEKILTHLVTHIHNQNPNAEIAGLVVSVPYDFGQIEKKATMRAIELAGLDHLLIDMIEEPKAAALTYNFSHNIEKDENILVFDFGGGTLDITIFSVIDKTDTTIYLKVISEGGSLNHGGDNLDKILFAHARNIFTKKTGTDISHVPEENLIDLYQRVRETKERLSQTTGHSIPFSFAIPPFMEKISRADFESMIQPFMEKTMELVKKSLESCHTGTLNPTDITRVLLEGGSSGMPWVKAMLTDMFGAEKIYMSKTPALDISLGATYYAAMKMGLLEQSDMQIPVEIESNLPHDIGVEADTNSGPVFMTIIPKGTSYVLAKKTQTFNIAFENEKDNHLHFKILERQNRDDSIEDCKHIGDVNIKNIPMLGKKTKVKLTLGAYDNMIIKGDIEIAGAISVFKKEFTID